MKPFDLFLKLAALLTSTVGAGKIGYFWQITDIHWDPKYGTKEHNCLRGGSSVSKRMYGDHNCDSPWALVESASHAMLDIHDQDLEFILWTGDGVTNSRNVNKMEALTNLTNLLSHVFASHFVFPVLGHDDPGPQENSQLTYHNLSELWKHWLPTEALVTFNTGGYYTIERKQTKLRLVMLNTNLWTGGEQGEDPGGQWTWLETTLNNSRTKKEYVYLVGHMAPGLDERLGSVSKPSMSTSHNLRYLSLVRQYADVITGQFFGHLHSDTFRLIYSDQGLPVSRVFMAPSLTPRRSTAGLNNPGLRLYKIQVDTGQVLDYSQYFLDLPTTEVGEADWTLLYNFTDYYALSEPSPSELHVLAENFTTQDGVPLFTKYLEANSVRSSVTSISSAHTHYCALTKLDYLEYQDCLATTAAPLAVHTSPTPLQNTSASGTTSCSLQSVVLSVFILLTSR